MRRADIISGADESDLFAFREWKKMNKDLFEEVALRIGCRYVSDMRDEPFRRFAKETLAQSIDLGEDPLGVLSDMYEYLYGKKVNFETYDQAKNAFVVKK